MAFVALVLLALSAGRAFAGTVQVVNTNDSGPGSLRDAIATENGDTTTPRTISFAIPTGPYTITLATPLPQITVPVTIDGTTQTPSVGQPVVVVDGSGLTSGDGLVLAPGSDGSVIRGLVVSGFPGDGIQIQSDGDTIANDYLGTDAAGNAAAPNRGAGVHIKIGTHTIVGGTTSADRNLISGNATGVLIDAGTSGSNDGNSVVGNYIGTNAAGGAAVPNGPGMAIGSANNTVRGNLVSGNNPGVELLGGNNLVAGNTIGLNAAGNASIRAGNASIGGDGVDVFGSSATIGGIIAADRNVIAGTGGAGISVGGAGAAPTDGTVVQGNWIGPDGSGSGNAAVEPDSGIGILIVNGTNTTIGGTTNGAGNVIAYNNGNAGVGVISGSGNTIRGNSIHDNANLGIDLAPSRSYGPTPNDSGDSDTGPNGLQNFPVISSVASDGTISGSLDSTANASFTVELFANTACDTPYATSGLSYGEGQTSLGTVSVATDATGQGTFTFAASPSALGGGISATATSSGGDTSEFSACVASPAGAGGGTGTTTTGTTGTTTTGGTTPANDGTGLLTTPLNPVTASSSGNAITFTYTAAAGGLAGGELTVAVPAGWSSPSTLASDAGYTTASAGTVSVNGNTIDVTGITLAGGATMTITYGDKSGSGPGAAAPGAAGTQTWSAQERSTPTGTLTAIDSPSVAVTAAASGSDSLTFPATPTSVAVGGSAVVANDQLHLNALPGSADIEVAIDTTGSMNASIAQAQRDATNLVNSVRAGIPNAQFAVVQFKDSGDNPEYQVLQSLTSNAAGVQSAIDGLSAGGGGDIPEAYNLVFHNSYTPALGGSIGWRSGTRKFVVVIGDAQPHGDLQTQGFAGCADVSPDPHGLSTTTELAGMNTNQRTLFMIRQAATASTTLQCYQSLAAAAYTGGQGVDDGTSLGAQIVGLVNQAASHVASVTFSTSTAGFTFTPTSAIGNLTTPATVAFDGTLAADTTVMPGSYTVTVTASADGAPRATGTLVVTVKAPISNVTLSVSPQSTHAGIDQLTIKSIPGTALSFYAGVDPNAPVGSVPFGGTPFGGTPFGGTPYGGTPFGGTPFGGTPFGGTGLLNIPYGGTPYGGTSVGGSALGSLLLSQIQLCGDVPLIGTTQAQCIADGATWKQVLGTATSSTGQQFVNLPQTSVTLGDVLADANVKARLAALPMQDVSLTTTLLKNVHMLSLLIGNAPLESIAPPAGFDSWCAGSNPALPSFGGSCAGVTATTPIIQLDVAGQIGSAPFGGTPFGGTPFGGTPFGGTPFGGTPMGGTPLAGSSIAISRVASIPLADLNPVANVVDCSKLSGGCTGRTIGDAAAANAFQPGVTWANPTLDAALTADGMTYNDIMIAILGATALPWENLPIQGLQPYAATKTQVTYTLSLNVDCSVTANGFTAKVHLPDGFFPAAGTSAVAFDNGPAAAVPDPVIEGRTAGAAAKLNTYDWLLTCPNQTAQTATLTFKSWVGLTLGKQTATASAVAGTFVATGGSADVTVGQNFEPNDDMSNAITIQPDTLVAGHIAVVGDQDFYQLDLTGLPRGTKVSFNLKVPTGADFDLAVTRPPLQGFFSTSNPTAPLATPPLQDLGVGLSGNGPLPSEGLQDIPFGGTPFGGTPFGGTPFGGTPFGGTPFGGTSTNRGDANEATSIVTSGETGFATIDVTGYNGSTSTSPYVLRVHETPPPTLPANCPARTFPGGAPTSFAPGTLPSSLSTSTKSVFVIDTQQMKGLYGATPVATLLSKLSTLTARSEVSGAVLDVSGNAAVRAAYTAWNANPCDITLRNNVVRSINDVISSYRNSTNGLPNLHYVVLDGNDDATPMAATTDPVSLSPEVDEAPDLAFTTANGTVDNALYAAEAQNYLLTDGAYGAFTSIPWLGHDLLLPQVSVSRLVETPADIGGQIDRYLLASGYAGTPQTGIGTLSPQTLLPAGYDFLADGAQAISNNLHTNFPGATIQSTLGTAGHAAIAFPGTTTPWTAPDLISSFFQSSAPADIASLNAHYNHYELEAADFATAAKTSDALASIASRILFTMGCHGGLNVADTLAPPGVTASSDPRYLDWPQLYSEKQVAVYIANTGFGYGDTDSVALSERLLALFAKNLHSDANSVGEEWAQALQQYFATVGVYDVFDEKVLEETTFYGLPFWHFGTAAPASPTFTPLTTSTDPVTGTQSAVVSFPGAGATTQTEFGLYRPQLPLTSQEVTSSSLPARGLWIKSLQTNDHPGIQPSIGFPTIDLSAHERPSGIAGIFFPADPFMLEHSNTFGKERDYVDVSSQFRPDGSAAGTGVQRDVVGASLEIFYGNGADRTPPLISLVGVTLSGTTASIQARVTDDSGTVAEVAALVNDGNWQYVQLARSSQDPTLWTGTATVSRDPEVFIEATDGANVGYSANKGSNFTSASSSTANGPQILIQAPNGVYAPNQAVNATYQCISGGSPLPASQCKGTVASGNAIDTSSFGPHTFVVTALDTSGNVIGSLQRVYYVAYAFKGFFPPVDNQPVLNVAKAGSAIPVKFSLSGNQGLNIFASDATGTYPKTQLIACDASAPADGVDSTVTAGNSSLSYDPTADQYTYVWKTDPTWSGTCRALIVKTKDGVVHRADFKFK